MTDGEILELAVAAAKWNSAMYDAQLQDNKRLRAVLKSIATLTYHDSLITAEGAHSIYLAAVDAIGNI